MAKEQLSDKQQQILEFIKRRILDKGYPPAVREICEAVNLRSTSSVHSHLETLECELGDLIGELDENQAFIAGQSPTGPIP